MSRKGAARRPVRAPRHSGGCLPTEDTGHGHGDPTTFDLSALPRAKPAARRMPDVRLLVGLALAVIVFGAGLTFWNVIAGPRTALVLQHDVPAGAVLAEADLAPSRVRVDGLLADQLVPADELPALIGRPVAEPLHAGELLLRPHLASRPAARPGMVLAAVSLKPETGPGAAAQPGSHVRVLATEKRGTSGDAATSVVLPDAEVVEVVQQARSALLAGGETRTGGAAEPVVLRVQATAEEAEALARAKVVGTLEVVLLGPGDVR